MNTDFQTSMPHWLSDPFVTRLVALAIGLTAVFLLTQLVRRALTRFVRDNTTRYQSRKAVTFLGALVALMFVASQFSDQLGGLTVAFGVAGAGIAFALQEVIASAAGWVAIAVGSFYRVGDRVQLGGIKGDVIDIGMLRTTIMEMGEWVHADQYNGRIVRVANSFVFKEPVYNYSADFPFLWDEILLPIRHGSDRQMARAILERVAQEVVGDYARSAETAWEPITQRYLIEKASVLPSVTMQASPNWLEFTLRYVVDYKKRRLIRDRLFVRLLEEVDASNGLVSLASASFSIDRVAPLEVSLHRRAN